MYYKRIKIISTEKLSFNMIKLANNAFIVRIMRALFNIQKFIHFLESFSEIVNIVSLTSDLAPILASTSVSDSSDKFFSILSTTI